MAVFNAAKREIDLKIVYYGPAMCGKTTNVQCIHKMLAPQQRGELMSLATKDDRTLFFDFLPIELGDVRGFKTRFHIYTVPGQVYYGLTRRAVLTGADGVVFVVDSQTNKLQENIESLKDLAENLKFYKKDLATFPFVFQYNKRDLAHIAPVVELDSMLNQLNAPAYESSAVTGMGVVETLTAICKMVLKQMDSGTAKKKPLQQQASVPSPAKAAAPGDTDLRLFTKQPVAPPPDKIPEPVQTAPTPPQPAAVPEQKPPFRLSPEQPSPLPFDSLIPPAVQPPESKAMPQFEGIKPQAPPPFDDGLSDMSADTGLTFDNEPSDISADLGLSFDDEPSQKSDDAGLSFEDEPSDLSAELGLSFDDEPSETSADTGLTFDDDQEVALDETAEPAPELSFDDDASNLVIEEPAFDMDETGLSFDDDAEAVDMPAVDGAVLPALADSSAYTLENPSHDFEDIPKNPDVSAQAAHTPLQSAVSIVACGSPQKISGTSLRLPIKLKLSQDGSECLITITISLDDMPF